MSLCHGWGWQPPQTASHMFIRHIESVGAHWYPVHLHTVAVLHKYPPYLAQILGYVVTCGVKMMSFCHGWGWQPPLTDFHIHIRLRHIQSVWAHWYAFYWYTLAALHSFTHRYRLRFWGFGWLVKSKWCYYESWQRPQTASHIYIRHIKFLSTLIWCPFAYSISLTQLSYLPSLLLCSDFGILSHLWSQNDIIESLLRLTATSNCFPHTY